MKIRNVAAILTKQLNLSSENLTEMLPGGRQTFFNNRVGWAKTYLKKEGILDNSSLAIIVITDAHKKMVEDNQ